LPIFEISKKNFKKISKFFKFFFSLLLSYYYYDLPQDAIFMPADRLPIFGIIIPGVSNRKTSGSSETRILVCKALVTPGLAPTLSGFPKNMKYRMNLAD
jgi:hypothetical protein